MADTEVENTLREIRERVLAAAPARAAAHAPVQPSTQTGVGASPSTQGGDAFEALARMDANLSTTARTWSRLPPVLSNRRGALARFELWLKRLIKRAAHWFTWEQVNFNSAAHNALGDARAAFDAHESALSSLREELGRVREELTSLRAEVESGVESSAARSSELESRISSAESRFDSRLAELQGALASGLDNLRGEQRARTETLRSDLRDRAEGLLEEQRVCFRQLSLEASELAVTQDRARRAIEARLEALEKTATSE